jgi:hypothetical protein
MRQEFDQDEASGIYIVRCRPFVWVVTQSVLTAHEKHSDVAERSHGEAIVPCAAIEMQRLVSASLDR